MNIFVTSECPIKSAESLPNVLVNKMIIETAQMLSTAHIMLDGVQVAYKKTHHNHPCSVWVRATTANYEWAYIHFWALCEEYTRRGGKIHKTSELLPILRTPPFNIIPGPQTAFAICVSDEIKLKYYMSASTAYKAYLNEKFKEWLARAKPVKLNWTNRKMPAWLSIN